MKCLICDADPIPIRGTDLHNQIACSICGMMYKYTTPADGATRPIYAEYVIPFIRQFWNEFHRHCIPKSGDLLNGPTDYVTQDDINFAGEWYQEHGDEINEAAEENKK